MSKTIRSTAAAAALLMLWCTSAAAAERYVDVWGPPVGSELPVLDAEDHRGERRSLIDLAGERGLLLFLVRSADW